MTKRAVVFQHMADDDLCLFAELLGDDGFTIDTVHMYDEQPIPDLAAYDLMMVLGGSMDVWETDVNPWLLAEQDAIREWVGERTRPYIGICLGHQLLANALGGRVVQADQIEVGLHRITVHTDAAHPFFDGLSGDYPVMQWHHAEVAEPPTGARVLASSGGCDIQAFAVGDHALGVQFHFEWTLERIRNWPQGWLEALHKELGDGAHDRAIADAAQHISTIDALARTIYGNFKRANGF